MIVQHLERMPEPLQVEVLSFVQRLQAARDGKYAPSAEEHQCLQDESPPLVPLSSLIGSCKGMFASPEEADAFLSGERDAWDS